MRFFAFLPVAVLAVACGASKAPPGPSTVSGSAAASTFPSAPSAVTATDEGGRAVRGPVAADGSFSLALAKSHTYTLAFATPNGDVSIVFPRATGKLDKSFSVKSDGALVRLGRVHYLAKAPAGGFHVTSTTGGTTPKTEQSGGDQGNCVDCVNDDGKTACESGGEGASSSESSSSEAPSSEAAADPNQEMAVGDQNAPDQVDGCGGDGADGADVQQEGDHTDPGDPAGSP